MSAYDLACKSKVNLVLISEIPKTELNQFLMKLDFIVTLMSEIF